MAFTSVYFPLTTSPTTIPLSGTGAIIFPQNPVLTPAFPGVTYNNVNGQFTVFATGTYEITYGITSNATDNVEVGLFVNGGSDPASVLSVKNLDLSGSGGRPGYGMSSITTVQVVDVPPATFEIRLISPASSTFAISSTTGSPVVAYCVVEKIGLGT